MDTHKAYTKTHLELGEFGKDCIRGPGHYLDSPRGENYHGWNIAEKLSKKAEKNQSIFPNERFRTP
jgi:hypothetical protein